MYKWIFSIFHEGTHKDKWICKETAFSYKLSLSLECDLYLKLKTFDLKRFSTVNIINPYKMLLNWKENNNNNKRHVTFFYLILLWTAQISSGSHTIKYTIQLSCSHWLLVMKASFTSYLPSCFSPFRIWSSLFRSSSLFPLQFLPAVHTSSFQKVSRAHVLNVSIYRDLSSLYDFNVCMLMSHTFTVQPIHH